MINTNKHIPVEQTVLCGISANATIPPAESLSKHYHPVVSFVNDKGIGFGLNEKNLSTGLLLTGETGSGKSTVIFHSTEAILQTLTSKDLVVILDVKGEFSKRFFDPNNEKHILFSPSNLQMRYSTSWNIFEELFYAAKVNSVEDSLHLSKEIEAKAYDLAKDIMEGIKGTSQPFFAEAAQSILAEWLADVVNVDCKRNGSISTHHFNNATLLRSFRDDDFASRCKDLADKHPHIRTYLGDYTNNQALGVLGTINTTIFNSFQGAFAKAEGRREGIPFFSMSQLLSERNGKVLFIEYDLARADSLNTMYRLLFEQLLKGALSLQNNSAGNIYVILDELSALPNLTSLSRAANIGRGKHLKLIASCQSISQLKSVYSEADAEALLEGFTNIIAFRSSNRDTREMIANRSGKNYTLLEYYYKTGEITTPRDGYAIEDWDILSLDTGNAYVLLSGYPPFKYHFPLFEKRTI